LINFAGYRAFSRVDSAITAAGRLPHEKYGAFLPPVTGLAVGGGGADLQAAHDAAVQDLFSSVPWPEMSGSATTTPNKTKKKRDSCLSWGQHWGSRVVACGHLGQSSQDADWNTDGFLLRLAQARGTGDPRDAKRVRREVAENNYVLRARWAVPKTTYLAAERVLRSPRPAQARTRTVFVFSSATTADAVMALAGD